MHGQELGGTGIIGFRERNQDLLGHCALQGEASRSGNASGSEADNLGARAVALGVYLRCVD